MSYVTTIIQAFGGVRPMARAVERPSSTVHSWKERGSIPDDQKGAVLAASNRLGLGLRPEDFFPHSRTEAAE